VSFMRFYELDKSPRVVRDAGGGLEKVTSRGSRRAPWWRWAVPETDVEDVGVLQRRCLQRLSAATLRAEARPETWASAWSRLLWQWIAPPLPCGSTPQPRTDLPRHSADAMSQT
jgi:hypothetical protein